jgi:hypothetical protein
MSDFFYSSSFTEMTNDINTLTLQNTQSAKITSVVLYENYISEYIYGKYVI